MDGVINKDIQVENIEAKMASTGNMKYILTDTGKNKYFFWQKNKGQDSEVYLSFTGMQLKKGDTCHIGYTEKDESFVNKEGKTINYKDRFILGLREASGSPAPAPAQSPRGEANRGQYGNSGRDFDKENVGKCQSLFLQAYLQAGNTFANTFLQVGQAKKLAEMVVYGSTETVAPDIQESAEQMSQDQGEDLNVEDVPF